MTITLGAMATAVPASAVWRLPARAAIWWRRAREAVALKVTGEPERPALVAVRVLAPRCRPSVQLAAVAMPVTSVVAVRR